MKEYIIVFLLVFSVCGCNVFSQEKLTISGLLTEDQLSAYLKSSPFSGYFPEAADRKAWETLKKKPLIQERVRMDLYSAEYLLQQSKKEDIYPALHLDAVTAYIRSGNRSVYEKKYDRRRDILSTHVIAECMEYKGRYIPLIMEGWWQIMCEPHWQDPAHCTYDKKILFFTGMRASAWAAISHGYTKKN